MHNEGFLKLADFDFDFPAELVAQTPAPERDSSRLLVHTGDGRIGHHKFSDLPLLLPKDSLLVLNDTSVLQSRLHGFLKTGARIEIFLLEPLASGDNPVWRALAKPLKKLKEGSEILLPPPGLAATGTGDSRSPVRAQIMKVEKPAAEGEVPAVHIGFSPPPGTSNFDFYRWLELVGETPLPPYIHRKPGDRAFATADRARYETIYASQRGSVAAPTAGLHFTAGLLGKLRDHGHQTVAVTLHVGGGTFLPVRQEDVTLHQMHHEKFTMSQPVLAAIEDAKRDGRPVICVGTTAFRCVESLFAKAKEGGVAPATLAGRWHATNLFVYPKTRRDKFAPAIADGIVTNFHQPKSTLFMLVSALIGLDEAHRMYRVAIEQRYRLFSYGDGSLLLFQGTSKARAVTTRAGFPSG